MKFTLPDECKISLSTLPFRVFKTRTYQEIFNYLPQQVRSKSTLRVQKYGNDGLKHGGKDVLWPMSLVTKGRFSLQPDLNLNSYGGKIFAISSSVYQTDKDKF